MQSERDPSPAIPLFGSLDLWRDNNRVQSDCKPENRVGWGAVCCHPSFSRVIHPRSEGRMVGTTKGNADTDMKITC